MENHGNAQAQTPINNAGYEALMKGAALVDHSHRILLRLVGKNSTEMLNAILTNVVPEEDNLGAYAALLNPKGRIQTDLRVLKADGEVFVDAEPEGAGAAREILGRYAPFYHVKVEDLSASSWGLLGLYGPRAGELLGNLRLAEHESARIEVAGRARVLAAGVATPVLGFDFLGPADTLRLIREYLLDSGTTLAGNDAYETVRVAASVPRFGADITPENFPAEAGILERAVSFQKGCYPGQETVARMYYRGHPNKTLHRLIVDGLSPAPGTPITQGEKQIGMITSTAPLLPDGRTLALGYLSRNVRTDAPLSAGSAIIHLA
ncbi:MAG: folate-binding protein YgfZ [Rubrobacter sp.]|nr:folate-binding protein YgfZ [Rubrobacter sp.]